VSLGIGKPQTHNPIILEREVSIKPPLLAIGRAAPHVANVSGLDYKVEEKQHNRIGRHKRAAWGTAVTF